MNGDAIEFAIVICGSLIILGVIIESFQRMIRHREEREQRHRDDAWQRRRNNHDT